MTESKSSSTPDAATAVRPRRRGPLESRVWGGLLCIDNYVDVAARMTRMLDGKWYTFVATHSDSGVRADVRTSNRLTAPIRVSAPGEAKAERWAHISCSDGHYVWGIHTDQKTEADARADERRRQVHVYFDHDEKLTIDQYSISGNHLNWVIAIEDHTDWNIEDPVAASSVNRTDVDLSVLGSPV
jgi:hypothetical protein